jgi:hypothetical protein
MLPVDTQDFVTRKEPAASGDTQKFFSPMPGIYLAIAPDGRGLGRKYTASAGAARDSPPGTAEGPGPSAIPISFGRLEGHPGSPLPCRHALPSHIDCSRVVPSPDSAAGWDNAGPGSAAHYRRGTFDRNAAATGRVAAGRSITAKPTGRAACQCAGVGRAIPATPPDAPARFKRMTQRDAKIDLLPHFKP